MSAPIKLDFKKAPEQNIDYLKTKGLSLSFDYYELQKEAHHKAFTVAKIMKLDVLADIQNSLTKAMNEGQSFKKWKNELTPLLQQKGWWGEKEVLNPTTGEVKTTYIGSRRLRTIFETNMRTSYAVGRANNIYGSLNEYIIYSAILDSRTRVDHRALNGIIKHRNDVFWEVYFPPNGWGCRCYVKSISKKELERRGLKVDTNEYTGLVDNDFSYDVRFLSNESLENSYYNKALNFTSEKIVKNAIDYIYSQDKIKAYQSFIDEVSKDKSYYKNIIPAGAISYDVFSFLKSKDIIPSAPHIYLDKKALTHMQREAKSKKEAALSLEEIRNLPLALNNPELIVYDTEHENILYIFSDSNDKENKIAVEINYISKAKSYNRIVTTGKVSIDNINGNIKSGIYEVIKKR